MAAMLERTKVLVEADSEIPPFIRTIMETLAGQQLIEIVLDKVETVMYGYFARNRSKTVFKKKIKFFGITVGTATVKMHDIEDVVREILNDELPREREVPIN